MAKAKEQVEDEKEVIPEVEAVEKKEVKAKKKAPSKKSEETEEVSENVKPAEETPEEETDEDTKTAKAGKRSAKAVKEAEELAEKEERKEKVAKGELDPSAEAIKGPAPKRRPTIERRSKGYQKVSKLVEADKEYTVKEATELVGKTSFVKFDASVELHINLNVDPRQADQNIRETVILPNGTGKTVRVAVFAPASEHEAAKKAGADIVGEDDFLEKLKKSEFDFDVLISQPQVMAKLGQYAKVLGPKGLMPNPKSGTVTKDVAKAVKEAKGGRIEVRVDDYGIIHTAVGKVSFTPKQIEENIEAVLTAVKSAKPSAVKGVYVNSISLASSMGPGIKVAQ